jgi:hypothetical protein
MKVSEEVAIFDYVNLYTLWEERDRLLTIYKEGHHPIPVSEGGKETQILVYLTLHHHFAIHVKRAIDFTSDVKIHNANICAAKKILEDTSNKERQTELDKLKIDPEYTVLIKYIESEYIEISKQEAKIEASKVRSPRDSCESFLSDEGINIYPKISLPGEKDSAQIRKNINDRNPDAIPVEISDDDPTNKDGLIHICLKAGIPHLYYCNDRIGILKVKASSELLNLALSHKKILSKATTDRGGTIASFSYVPINEIISNGLGDWIAKSVKGVLNKV